MQHRRSVFIADFQESATDKYPCRLLPRENASILLNLCHALTGRTSSQIANRRTQNLDLLHHFEKFQPPSADSVAHKGE